MKISDELLRIGAKLQADPDSLTALDAQSLRQCAQAVARKLGYEGLNDTALLADAATLAYRQRQEQSDDK